MKLRYPAPDWRSTDPEDNIVLVERYEALSAGHKIVLKAMADLRELKEPELDAVALGIADIWHDEADGPMENVFEV